MHIQATVGVFQREVLHRHVVGLIQVDQCTRAITWNGWEQASDLAHVDRAGDGEAFVQAHTGAAHQAHVHAARSGDGVDHGVVTGVDVEHRAGHQGVGAQHIDRVGLGRIGRLAGVAVVAHGRGQCVIGGGLVVDVVGLTVFRHAEGLLAAVDHRWGVDQRDLNAQALGAKVDARVAGDPDELAVVGRGRRDVLDELGAIQRVLDQVDANFGEVHIVDCLPPDGVGHTLFPIGV